MLIPLVLFMASWSSRPTTHVSYLDTVATDTITVDRLRTVSTPDSCFALMSALFKKDMQTAKRVVANADYRENAATCGRRFDPLTIDSAHLSSATYLYQVGHLDRELFMALDRPIHAASTDSARSSAILHAMSALVDSHDYSETPSWAAAERRYIAQLDQVPHVRALDLIKGHLLLAQSYIPGDLRWQEQVDAANRAAKGLDTAERQTEAGREALCEVDHILAVGAAHADHYQQATTFLDHCLSRWPVATTDSAKQAEDWQVGTWRKELREYAFVGHPVPAPLDAPHWLNAPATTTGVDLTRPATLVEFTWTGCPECHKGYPALRNLYARFHGQGVNFVFMTYLFAQTPQHDTATVEQELAYDNWFWHDDKPMPFQIGVLAHPDTTGYPDLFNTYAVIGAPTYYIIDRHGVIRFVQEGHSEDLETHMTSVITHLLAE